MQSFKKQSFKKMKSFARLIVATLCVLALAMPATQTWAANSIEGIQGDGTEETPFLVGSGQDLDAALIVIAEDYYVVSGDNVSNMHYIELSNDIDAIASSTYGNEDDDHPVRVTIDGKGHTIRGTLPDSAPAHATGAQYTGLRFANRTPWTVTDPATGTGKGNHIVLKNLTVSGLYNAETHGGGAFAIFGGKVEVDNSIFSGNASYSAGRGGTGEPGRGGGAILLQHRASVLSVKNSTFIGNTATGAGGAIDSSGDQDNVTLGENVIIENSTFYGNKSGSASGGGAIAYSRARGRITNSTIVGNEATSGKGGGVLARDNVAGNASGLGDYSDFSLINSIVIGNGSGSYTDVDFIHRNVASPDFYVKIAGAYNLVGTSKVSLDNTRTGVSISAVLVSGAPQINVRGTPTIALSGSSLAIDAADAAQAPEKDQRGYSRLRQADIGAFESFVLPVEGTGSAASPYIVSSGTELDQTLVVIAEDFRPNPDTDAVNNNISDMHYISLAADIDAVTSSTYGEEDIDHPVRVTIDGNGHAIRGILPDSAPAHAAGAQYTGLRFANRTPWTETATGTGRGNHIVLKNLTVSGLYNAETHGGGAFAIFGGKVEVDNSVFDGNASYAVGRNGAEAGRGGGAILLQHRASVLSVKNSTFVNNTATGAGGAIDSSGDRDNVTLGENVIIENSTFYGNKSGSASGGGAIAYSRALGRITNSTIVGNEVKSGKGGGVLARDNVAGNASGLGTRSDFSLINSIVAGNGSGSYTDVDLSEPTGVEPENHARITGDYNLIGISEVAFGENTSTGVDVSAVLVSGAPQINVRGTPTIALSDSSLAIDAADTEQAPEKDQRGYSRLRRADIGAFESFVLPVEGTGSAASPYIVSSGTELDQTLVVIAEDFRPNPDVDAVNNNISDMHYIRLAADIDAVTSSTYGEEDIDHPVRVTINGNGYSIRGTLPDSAPTHVAGAQYTGLRFANRTPWTETATGTGRGNHIVLKNLTVSGLYNAETHGGGAFAIFGGKVEVDNSVFSGNASYAVGRDGAEAGRGGGAILLQHRASVLSVKNSTFINNIANGAGGAIDSSGDQENVTLGENVIIENSTFYGNKSGSASGGGAIAYSRARGRITNSTIVGNEVASGKGGGVLARDNVAGNPSGLGTRSDFSLINSIVAGNGSGSYTDVDLSEPTGVEPENHARIIGDYNLIGISEVAFGKNTSTGVDISAVLVSGAPQVNVQGTPTIALLAGSPAVDAADSESAPATDQRGFARHGDPDIGAYELQPASDGDKPDDPLTPDDSGTSGGSGTPSVIDVVATPPVKPTNDGVEIGSTPTVFSEETQSELPVAMSDSVIVSGGVVVADVAAVQSGLGEADAEQIDDEETVVSLPVFATEVSESGKTAVVTFDAKLGDFDGLPIGNLLILKLKPDGVTALLTSADSLANITDGKYIWTDSAGAEIAPSTSIVGDESYYFNVAIKDNGEYDWETAEDGKKVIDPLAMAVKKSDENLRGSSGGGCDAGFGVFALTAFGVALLSRKQTRLADKVKAQIVK